MDFGFPTDDASWGAAATTEKKKKKKKEKKEKHGGGDFGLSPTSLDNAGLGAAAGTGFGEPQIGDPFAIPSPRFGVEGDSGTSAGGDPFSTRPDLGNFGRSSAEERFPGGVGTFGGAGESLSSVAPPPSGSLDGALSRALELQGRVPGFNGSDLSALGAGPPQPTLDAHLNRGRDALLASLAASRIPSTSSSARAPPFPQQCAYNSNGSNGNISSSNGNINYSSNGNAVDALVSHYSKSPYYLGAEPPRRTHLEGPKWNPLGHIDRYWQPQPERQDRLGPGSYRYTEDKDPDTGCGFFSGFGGGSSAETAPATLAQDSNGQILRIQVTEPIEGTRLGLTVTHLVVTRIGDPRALRNGWRVGDRLLRVNGVPVNSTGQFLEQLSTGLEAYRARGVHLEFEVLRKPPEASVGGYQDTSTLPSRLSSFATAAG